MKVTIVSKTSAIRKDLDKEWTANPSLSALKKWEMLQSKIRTSKKNGIDTVARDIIFQYSYPRLDSHVSIGLNHLLKSPFCVHPKTGKDIHRISYNLGRVCVPIDPSKCNEFDPFSVPLLQDLIDEPAGKRKYFHLIHSIVSSVASRLF
jgi:DNA primase small subunit